MALREFVPEPTWNEKMMRFSFCSINIGLVVMLMFGLIPNGFYQLGQSLVLGIFFIVKLNYVF
jgi:nitric oxide reductase subunit B